MSLVDRINEELMNRGKRLSAENKRLNWKSPEMIEVALKLITGEYSYGVVCKVLYGDDAQQHKTSVKNGVGTALRMAYLQGRITIKKEGE